MHTGNTSVLKLDFFFYNHFLGKNCILNINLAIGQGKNEKRECAWELHFSSGICNPSLLTLTIFRTLYIYIPVGNIYVSHILLS